MNILHILPFYYPDIGGVEIYIKQLSKELVKRGHQVGVVTSQLPGTPKGQDQVDGIQVLRLPSIFGKENPFPSGLSKAISEIKPDIINTHGFLFYFSYLAAQSIKKNPIPLVFTFHGDFDFLKGYHRIGYFIKRKIMGNVILGNCDGIVVTSNMNQRLLEQRYRVSTGRLWLIPYGIDHHLFRPALDPGPFKKKFNINADRYILNVGRLEEEKGVDLLLSAYNDVCNKYPDVALVVVGDGSKKEWLVKISKDMPGRNVIFTGEITPGEMLASAYSGAELFVLPSKKEPFGIVLLEALASGTPIVASDDGGFTTELIQPGKYGYLFSSGNPSDLAAKITTVLRHQEASRQMAQNARNNRLDNFTWDVITGKILEMYKQIYKGGEK